MNVLQRLKELWYSDTINLERKFWLYPKHRLHGYDRFGAESYESLEEAIERVQELPMQLRRNCVITEIDEVVRARFDNNGELEMLE